MVESDETVVEAPDEPDDEPTPDDGATDDGAVREAVDAGPKPEEGNDGSDS